MKPQSINSAIKQARNNVYSYAGSVVYSTQAETNRRRSAMIARDAVILFWKGSDAHPIDDVHHWGDLASDAVIYGDTQLEAVQRYTTNV